MNPVVRGLVAKNLFFIPQLTQKLKSSIIINCITYCKYITWPIKLVIKMDYQKCLITK